ncbi:MAG TPA: ferulic acid esterase [Pseudonocardiaceae bacterium]|nr:ferulic acid esterase [Pseudonocardiaceae bacterium]
MRLRLAACLALLTVAATAIPASAADVARNHPIPSFGCFRAPDLPLGQTVTASIESGGYQRTYRIHLPASYRSFIPTPVILTFGGRNESSTAIEGYTGFDDLNAVAVYPDGLTDAKGETSFGGAPYSPPGDDVLFVSDLLDRLQSTLCVDPFRIYADGKSNGGGFTALLACQLEHRIAAFGMVSGAFYPQSTVGCTAGTPVSLVEFHGTADTVINYNGDNSRQGSTLPPVMDWIAGWAAHDHCAADPVSTDIGTDVVKFAYPGCIWFSSVQHYRVIGGGHTWPGATVHNGPGVTTQTISATAIMWRFFLSHPLR